MLLLVTWFFSFLKFSGYNENNMHPYDVEKSVFKTPKAISMHNHFGLKNVGASYHRAMAAIFHDVMIALNIMSMILLWSFGRPIIN